MDQQPGKSNPPLLNSKEFGCLAVFIFILAVVSLKAFTRLWLNSQDWITKDFVYDSNLYQFRIFFLLFAMLGWVIGVFTLVRIYQRQKGRILTYLGLLGCACLTLVFFEIQDIDRRRIDQQRKTPSTYQYDFMRMKSWLAKYRDIHGKYPPALIPYWPIDRQIEEARDRTFPKDHYAEESKHVYVYDAYQKKWLDKDKPMKDNPTTADFDPTGWYRYYSDGQGYIIIGNGPDRDADLDAKESFLAARNGDFKKLIANKYDPTNGTTSRLRDDRSSGDYFILKLK